MSPGLSAIRATGLAKTYRIYDRPVDRLLEGLTGQRRHREFQALRPLDLDIARGQTVGVVGRNGSGKSTLLQLIAGTLQPTAGRIEVNGRVAALLELGSGFSPDFSGRENVYLNAQVLGMRRHEIEARFERIEAFADIGAFIDQPVRTYSSGMLVRLAFAVAIHTDPDILIIDEALAVGDEAFQRKCYSRIEAIKARGATILFVSHSASSVLNLCDRAVLLDGGERLLTGSPKLVVGSYQRLLHAPPDKRSIILAEIAGKDAEGEASGDSSDSRPGYDGLDSGIAASSREFPLIRPWPIAAEDRLDEGLLSQSRVDYVPAGAVIGDWRLLNEHGERVNILKPGNSYRLVYSVQFDMAAFQVEFNMTLRSVDGIVLYGASSHGLSGFIPMLEAGSVVEVEFAFESRLLPGVYFFNVGCQAVADGETDRRFLHRILDAGAFRIEGRSSDRYKIGFYDLSSEPTACWRFVRKPGGAKPGGADMNPAGY